jgi:hypothetical protein
VENVWVFGWKNIIIYVLKILQKKNTSIRKLLNNEKKMKKKSIDNKNKNKKKAKTTKNETATKKPLRKWKNMLEFIFGAQVGVKVLSSNLHMARTREVPY